MHVVTSIAFVTRHGVLMNRTWIGALLVNAGSKHVVDRPRFDIHLSEPGSGLSGFTQCLLMGHAVAARAAVLA